MTVIRQPRTALRSTIRTRIASAMVAFGVAVAVVPAASAQAPRGGIGSLFVPDFLPRDLPVFVDSLGLEEWQRPIMEALLDDYQTNFATAADGVRAQMGQFKDVAGSVNPDEVIGMITKPLVAWGEEKRQLREDFLQNVRSQLSDVQTEQWPKLERALRREKSLPAGELSGESLNLVMLIRELDVPPLVLDGAFVAIEEYERSLDAALSARDAEIEGSIANRLKAMGPNDTQKLQSMEERIMARRVQVRSIQEQSLATIVSALGSEYGEKLRLRALRRAFPQAYGPDPVSPIFESALAIPDLTETQKAQLNDLRSQFASEHAVIQDRYAEAIRRFEPLEPRRRAEAIAQRKATGGTTKISDSPEIDAVKADRQSLFTRFRAAIAEILNDQQKELVPGFGKPGADLPGGQRYGDAVHLGTGGSGAGGKGVATPVKPGGNSLIQEERIDPAIKPRDGGRGTTDPETPRPAKSPKAE
jgi:hypothetical protein